MAGFCALVLFTGLALRGYEWVYGLDNGHILQTERWRFVEQIYYPSYMRLDGVLIGVVLAMIEAFRPTVWATAMRQPHWLLGGGLIVSAWGIWMANDRLTLGSAVFGFPLLAIGFGLVVASAASPLGLVGRWRVPGAQAIATITFSLYLTHKMTWHAVRVYAPDLVPAGTAQAFLVYAGAALIAAVLIYFAVERPFLRLRTTITRRRNPGQFAGLRSERNPSAAQVQLNG